MRWRPRPLGGYIPRPPGGFGLGRRQAVRSPIHRQPRPLRTIGVISDTHGLLREEALRALDGSDLILHAGDVGDGGILERLADIAPVRAVRGNTDRGALARNLPETEVVDLSAGASGAGPLAYLIHQLDLLDLDPVAAGLRVVVYGHTHVPDVDVRAGVLYFNPGAAGHRRFRLPVTVGRLVLEGDDIEAEIVQLDGD